MRMFKVGSEDWPAWINLDKLTIVNVGEPKKVEETFPYQVFYGLGDEGIYTYHETKEQAIAEANKVVEACNGNRAREVGEATQVLGEICAQALSASLETPK